MAVRKPIISPDIKSHRELLTENDVIYYKKGKLEEAINRSTELDSATIKSLSNNVYKISRNYSYDKRAKNIANLMLKEVYPG